MNPFNLSGESPLALAAIWAFALAVYLLPSLIAIGVRSKDWVAISGVNIVLGVTGLGWIAALIWAIHAAQTSPRFRAGRVLELERELQRLRGE